MAAVCERGKEMEQSQLDILHLILNASLVVKLVILLLIGFSVYTWAIVLMKYSAFRKISGENKTYVQKFSNFESIFDISENDLSSKSPMSLILTSSINELKKVERASKINDGKSIPVNVGLSTLERTIENSISEISFNLRQFNATLASISSIAPFVGLFGTVWGIINSFQGLAGGSSGTVQAVAPGIAEALVATAIGLAAAIPANWFFNKFTTDASRLEQQLENFGKDVINLIERSM